jgi:release factor glutamine methyltransferase
MFPILDHLLLEDYQHVYEPSDDTFLLCDALEKDMQQGILGSSMSIACEVGCGSGCVITHLARLYQEMKHPLFCLGIDINPKALEVTNRTGIRNGILLIHSLNHILTYYFTL